MAVDMELIWIRTTHLERSVIKNEADSPSSLPNLMLSFDAKPSPARAFCRSPDEKLDKGTQEKHSLAMLQRLESRFKTYCN